MIRVKKISHLTHVMTFQVFRSTPKTARETQVASSLRLHTTGAGLPPKSALMHWKKLVTGHDPK